jgi:hypothetical protein
MYIRQNIAKSFEDLVNFEHMENYIFQDYGKVREKVQPISYTYNRFEKNSVYQTTLYRDNEQIVHERKIYGFLDLLGDLGGVKEVVLTVFAFFLSPIS